jgi:nucleoside-diphosphate-sugar epimerase
MFQPSPKSAAPPALSKVVADFLVVHTSLVFALVASWIRSTEAADDTILMIEARLATAQYLHLFLPLSLIFPAAFFLSGMYKTHLGWPLGRRVVVLLRGVAFGLLVFIPVSLFFLPISSLGSRSLILFCVTLAGLLLSARFGEWALLNSSLSAERQTKETNAEDRPVLVIGGAGYIGCVLVEKLLQSGRRVRVLDSLVYGDGALRDVINHPRLELMIGDCRNLQSVIRAVDGVESIVHLAAIVGDPACAQDHETALQVNYAATRLLVEVAKGHGIQRFVFASSCSVYGASEDLLTEESPVDPISLYARTKVDSEIALLEASDRSFRPTILRLATVFGLSSRPRFDLVVNLLTAKACQRHPITLFNGEQWRPFIHVSDVADGLLKVLTAPLEKVGGMVFNLGDGRLNYTLTDIAKMILASFPEATIEHSAAIDKRNYRVSFAKVQAAIGFDCAKTLSYGIDEIRAAFAEGRILDYASYQYNNQKFLEVAGSPINQEEDDESVMAAFSRPKELARAMTAAS